ncbi:MAG: sodium:solute symporter family protein [Maledivibacter sp.]|nr:sodium:solute symporter family protein [Maledivibacter sp.]
MNILDILGIILVFATVAYIGYRSSKSIKNSEDFLIAGRSLGKMQAGLSMAASDLGGSGLIGAAAYCYTVGIAGAWWNWCAAPAFIILGLFFVQRLRPLAVSTGPEFLERRYDKKSRLISSVMQICSGAASLSAQFVVAAVALNVIAGIDQNLALGLSVIFVLLYTMGGGLIAVVNTDVFQFFILVGSILVALPLALNNVGGFGELINSVPEEFFNIGAIGYWTPISWILMCFFTYSTSQAFLQRVFASKDTSTAKFAYVFTGITYIFYGAAVGLIGIVVSVMMPGLADTNAAYPLLIKEILPEGLVGIALGGIFAATMSTSDSKLMSITHLFVNDIYKPYINKDADDKSILRMSRIVTLACCVLAVGFALLFKDLIKIVYIAGLFYSTAVFFPMILGTFWKRGNAQGAFAGIISAIVVGSISEFFLKGNFSGILGLPSNITGSLSGLIIFVIVSLATPKPSEEKIAFINELNK